MILTYFYVIYLLNTLKSRTQFFPYRDKNAPDRTGMWHCKLSLPHHVRPSAVTCWASLSPYAAGTGPRVYTENPSARHRSSVMHHIQALEAFLLMGRMGMRDKSGKWRQLHRPVAFLWLSTQEWGIGELETICSAALGMQELLPSEQESGISGLHRARNVSVGPLTNCLPGKTAPDHH